MEVVELILLTFRLGLQWYQSTRLNAVIPDVYECKLEYNPTHFFVLTVCIFFHAI